MSFRVLYLIIYILFVFNLPSFGCLDDIYVFHGIDLSNKVTVKGLFKSPIKGSFLTKKGSYKDALLPKKIETLKVCYLEASSSFSKFEGEFQNKGLALSPLIDLVKEDKSKDLFQAIKFHTESLGWEGLREQNGYTEVSLGDGSVVYFTGRESRGQSLKEFKKMAFSSLKLSLKQEEYLSSLYETMFDILESVTENYRLTHILLRWNESLPSVMLNAPYLHYDTDLEGGSQKQIAAVLPILNNGTEFFEIKGKNVFVEVGKEAHMSIHNETILHRSPFAKGKRMALILFFSEKQ